MVHKEGVGVPGLERACLTQGMHAFHYIRASRFYWYFGPDNFWLWGRSCAFSSILDLYSLEGNSLPQVMTIKNASRRRHVSPGGQSVLFFRTTTLHWAAPSGGRGTKRCHFTWEWNSGVPHSKYAISTSQGWRSLVIFWALLSGSLVTDFS